MRTTGPILAIGGITLANQSIVHTQPVSWRVPVATGLAAGIFALLEKAWGDGAVALAYLALASILFTRIDKSVPSPVESFVGWWNSAGG